MTLSIYPTKVQTTTEAKQFMRMAVLIEQEGTGTVTSSWRVASIAMSILVEAEEIVSPLERAGGIAM